MRKPWEYLGCKIVPERLPEPTLVGYGYTRHCWRIWFPDNTWIRVATKNAARAYIEGYTAAVR